MEGKMNFPEPQPHCSKAKAKGKAKTKPVKVRKFYASYENFDYHLLSTLIRDETNVNFYRRIFQDNKDLFKDKVVLDAGCGSGLLSLFAAKAGAAKVYAIEGTTMASYLTTIFRKNRASHVITLIHSEVEEAELPEGTKVDVIFSGWMSHCGFYKLFYAPVIFARDKWLKSNGIIIPDVLNLYVVGVTDQASYDDRIESLRRIQRFNFNCLREAAVRRVYSLEYDANKIATTKYLIHCVEMNSASISDVEHRRAFALRALRNEYMHAVALYFDVGFMKGRKVEKISTSPDAEANCWKPHLFYLNEPLALVKNERVKGIVNITYSADMTKMVEIQVEFNGSLCNHRETKQFVYMD